MGLPLCIRALGKGLTRAGLGLALLGGLPALAGDNPWRLPGQPAPDLYAPLTPSEKQDFRQEGGTREANNPVPWSAPTQPYAGGSYGLSQRGQGSWGMTGTESGGQLPPQRQPRPSPVEETTQYRGMPSFGSPRGTMGYHGNPYSQPGMAYGEYVPPDYDASGEKNKKDGRHKDKPTPPPAPYGPYYGYGLGLPYYAPYPYAPYGWAPGLYGYPGWLGAPYVWGLPGLW